MKAMILAAGFGTRLRPLTDTIPKALIEINGEAMLGRIIKSLKKSGFDEIIINTHHLSGKIEEYLEKNHRFGIRVEISKEEKILGTGGGLKKAEWFLNGKEPFILHNCDIYTDMDYSRFYGYHLKEKPLATLAVRKRESRSYLVFDESMRLKGLSRKRGNQPRRLAFSGIHAISPSIFKKMKEEGFFSIIDLYLRLAEEGERIIAYTEENSEWHDIGKKEKLRELRRRNE